MHSAKSQEWEMPKGKGLAAGKSKTDKTSNAAINKASKKTAASGKGSIKPPKRAGRKGL